MSRPCCMEPPRQRAPSARRARGFRSPKENAGVGIRTTAPAVIQRHTMKQHEYQQPATGSETHLPHASTYLRTKTGSCVSETRPMARKFCLVGDPACIKVGVLFPPPTP